MGGDFRSTRLCILCCHHLKVMFVSIKHQRAQIWCKLSSGTRVINCLIHEWWRWNARGQAVSWMVAVLVRVVTSQRTWGSTRLLPQRQQEVSVHNFLSAQVKYALKNTALWNVSVPVTCQTGGDLTCSCKSSQFIIYPCVFLCLTSLPSVPYTYSRQIIR